MKISFEIADVIWPRSDSSGVIAVPLPGNLLENLYQDLVKDLLPPPPPLLGKSREENDLSRHVRSLSLLEV